MNLAITVATVGLITTFVGAYLMSKKYMRGLGAVVLGHVLMISAMALKDYKW